MHQDPQGYTRDLALARTAAQLRTRGSKRAPAVSVIIQEESHVQYTQIMGRYLGDIQSKITYTLEPDFEDTKQALGRVGDVVGWETWECPNSKKKRRHVTTRRRELKSLF